MASPPFGLNTSTPADNDIVSQFPALNRSDKDQLQSWIEVDHDTNGRHVVEHMVYQGSTPATPPASVANLYVDGNGNLIIMRPDGIKYYVGVPPGTVSFTANGVADNGWVLANGAAIARIGANAVLFSIIGTSYGAGDGSTTFNVPDIKGRVIAGKEDSPNLLSLTYFVSNSSVMGSKNGADNHALGTSNMPPYTPAGTIANGAITFPHPIVTSAVNGAIGAIGVNSSGATGGDMTNAFGPVQATSTFSGTPQGGTSTPFSIVQPTIILLAQIKL